MMKAVSHPFVRLTFTVTAAFLLLLFTAYYQTTAAAASLNWGSNFPGSGSVTDYGVYNSDNTTVLATGNLVQLIWAGPNGQIDPPSYDGTPSCDDVVLATNTINNGAPLPPPQQNKGYFSTQTYLYDTFDPQMGGTVYVRAWNNNTAGGQAGATHYGHSATTTLNGVDNQGFNALRWHTNQSVTPPRILVQQGTASLCTPTTTVNYGITPQLTPVTLTYTVTNIGFDPLVVTPTISVPSGFVVAQSFATTTLPSLTSTTFQVALTAATPGTFSGNISFATNDTSKNPLVFAVTGTVIAPEIQVRDGATPISNGGSVAFGTTNQPTPITKTFTISNTGTADLTLSNLSLPTGFSLVSGFTSPVAPGNSTTLVVRLTAAAAGNYSGSLSFNTNQVGANPFTFTLTGTVITPQIAVRQASTAVPNGGSFAFGTADVPTPIVRTFTISNTGTANLTLASLSVPAGFSVVTGFASPVLPGQTTTLVLQLDAAVAGVYSGTVSFNTNDLDDNPFTFTVSGTAVTPQIAVAQATTPLVNGVSQVDYGTTAVQNPVHRTYTITNTGTADLTLANLTLPTGYALNGSFPTTLTPTQSGTFTISLSATAGGTFTGNIAFTNNTLTDTPFTIGVTGTVLVPLTGVWDGTTFVPDNTGTVSFGTAVIGNPITKTFTISNTGATDLHLSNLAVPAGFSIINGLGNPTVVAPNAATTIVVQMNAAALGNPTGTLSFTTNDPPRNPYNFTISGQVVPVPTPDIEVRDGATVLVDGVSTVNFGSTTLGTPLTRTFTVQNVGNAPLTLADLSVPSGFAIAQNFGQTTLAPNETTTFAVALTAASLGSPSGSLSFSNNDPDENPFNFTVAGTVTAVPAPAIEVRDGATLLTNGVSTVNYGATTVGTPLQRTFTVQNVGSAPLTLADLAVPTGFQIVANFESTTLAPTESTTFVVGLTAAITGTFSGNVSFTNNDANASPFIFTVAGNVTAAPEPEIVVEVGGINLPNGTGSVAFGSTVIGTPVLRTITVRNLGTADLTLANLGVTGTGFSIATGFGNSTIVPGGSTTFQVRLDAASVGNFNGTVTFDNNDPHETPYSFAVAGNVTAAPEASLEVTQNATVVANSGSIALGTTVGGSPLNRTFTVRNTGTAPLTLAGLTVVGDGFTLFQDFASTTVAVGDSTTFVVRLTADTLGSISGTVSFTNNAPGQNPFSFTITAEVTAPPTPEIELLDGSTNIAVGGTVQMGTTTVGTPLVKTFTIRNIGSQTLTVEVPQLPAGYTLVEAPASSVAAGQSTTFQVRLEAAAVGTFSGTVSIGNNDADENPFTFTLTGVVEEVPVTGFRIFLPLITR